MIEVVAARSVGKYDDPARNEDVVVTTGDFFAVIDGATAKNAYQGISPGRRAAEAVAEAIRSLAPDAGAREAVDILSAAVAAIAADAAGTEPPTASVLMLAARRDELWVVGDGWTCVDGVPRRFDHEIERRGAAARAALLRAELLQTPLAELLETDPGRAMIVPLLQREALLSNADRDDDLAFGRLDGRRVPDALLNVVSLPPDWTSVVLASDGYPLVLGTVEESEQALAERLRRDPLMIEEPPATKGLGPGRISYDDRSWLELRR